MLDTVQEMSTRLEFEASKIGLYLNANKIEVSKLIMKKDQSILSSRK